MKLHSGAADRLVPGNIAVCTNLVSAITLGSNESLDFIHFNLTAIPATHLCFYDLLTAFAHADAKRHDCITMNTRNTLNGADGIGSAGVGKTCLLLRCLNDEGMLARTHLYPIFCDCREEGDVQVGLGKVRQLLSSSFKSYLQGFENKTNERVLPGEVMMTENPHEQYRLIVRAVLNLRKEQVDKMCPVLFIDDIDYSERKAQEELLTLLLPLRKRPLQQVGQAYSRHEASTIEMLVHSC